jgi:hypothetical protein
VALTGGFVAGIRAGFAYNTWPLMNGHWIPPEILMIEPWWRNFGYNMATVQFVHRTLALGAGRRMAFVAGAGGGPAGSRPAAGGPGGGDHAQVALGIATLVMITRLPRRGAPGRRGGGPERGYWLAGSLRLCVPGGIVDRGATLEDSASSRPGSSPPARMIAQPGSELRLLAR